MFELTAAHEEVKRLSRLLEEGLAELRSSAEQLAEAERSYRRAKGLAWVKQLTGTAAQREAQVDADTADLRYTRDLAEGMRRSAYENIRARTAQISVVQSLLSAHRAEAQFARTGPAFDDNRYPV